VKCSICRKEVGEGMNKNYYTIDKFIFYYDIFYCVYGYKEVKQVKILCEECYNRIFKKKE